MQIKDSRNYDKAAFEITPQDFSILFNYFDIGVRQQIQIIDDIWEQYRWVLPLKYRKNSHKKDLLRNVLYQIDYLYQKEEIDGSIEIVEKNASEFGISLKTEKLTMDYDGISESFKKIWFQIHYINSTGYTRAKLRTILDKYNYRRRTERFCRYFDENVYFYKLACTVKGESFDVRTVPLDTMITFRALKRRKRKSH